MEYFKRLRDVLTFFVILLAPPLILYKYNNDLDSFLLVMITWLPALFITTYLADY